MLGSDQGEWLSESVRDFIFTPPPGMDPSLCEKHYLWSICCLSQRRLGKSLRKRTRGRPSDTRWICTVPAASIRIRYIHVSIRVYDMLGREVETLVDRAMAAGVHEVTFEASQLPTGMYLIRMEAAGTVQIQRVTLMK